jgi:hypothetical protein
MSGQKEVNFESLRLNMYRYEIKKVNIQRLQYLLNQNIVGIYSPKINIIRLMRNTCVSPK